MPFKNPSTDEEPWFKLPLMLRKALPSLLSLFFKGGAPHRARLLFLFVLAAFFTPTAHSSPLILTNPFPYLEPFAFSPFYDWKTLKSDHFLIYFSQENQEIATRSARYLEEAHALLSPLLHWTPAHPVKVFLLDNQDMANGMTTPLLQLGIVLWSTPPDSTESLTFYDDWLKLLVIHEYTHYLHLDTTHGVWQTLRTLWGDLLLPNGMLPKWMIEGLAVYMETRLTAGGRGRSPHYDMILRAAVEENRLDSPSFISLDRITSPIPYYPDGDIPYVFGYHLMSQLAKSTPQGSWTLGELSHESAKSFPLLINQHLENLTQKNWYDYWNEWKETSRVRAERSLEIIRSKPLTKFELITERDPKISNEVFGSALSPDETWLAYTLKSADRRSGLFLRNLKTREVTRLDDKLGGFGMSFTSDSQALIYSELNRLHVFDFFSDLKVLDLKTRQFTLLTQGLRAKDPDVSRDDQWVTFTLSEHYSTILARAPLLHEDQGWRLGPIEKILIPEAFDRIANPKFSADGKKIFFNLHRNGKFQEDLMVLDLSTQQSTPVISDGFFNRFPAINSQGDLFYVSNQTGVDLLYRYDPKTQTGKPALNVTTGIALPSFYPRSKPNEVYASLFSTSGWDLAYFQLNDENQTESPPKLSPPELPSESLPKAAETQPTPPLQTEDYQALPTLLPRVWTPLLSISPNSGTDIGAQVMGFDATNRHRYVAGGSFNTLIQSPDGMLLYSNRLLGPSVNFSLQSLTTAISPLGPLTTYSKQDQASLSASYTLPSTYSWLTPFLSLSVQKLSQSFRIHQQELTQLTQATPLMTNLDMALNFSTEEVSRLAITTEAGSNTFVGVRTTFFPNEITHKALLIHQDYFRLTPHTILSPSLKALWSSNWNPDPNAFFSPSSSLLNGRVGGLIHLGGSSSDGFNRLWIRGYPGLQLSSKLAGVSAVDLKFPLARIFSGWGTNPLFLNNLVGFTFLETSFLSTPETFELLPSLGGGVRLTTETLRLPISLGIEFHQGLSQKYNGTSDLIFSLSAQVPT